MKEKSGSSEVMGFPQFVSRLPSSLLKCGCGLVGLWSPGGCGRELEAWVAWQQRCSHDAALVGCCFTTTTPLSWLT